MNRVHIIVLLFCSFLAPYLGAQTSEWYISNKDFFVLEPIAESQRHEHEYVLEIVEQKDEDRLTLYSGSAQKGSIVYQKTETALPFREEYYDENKMLREVRQYQYDSHGNPRRIRRKLFSENEEGNKVDLVVNIKSAEYFEIFELFDDDNDIRNSYDSLGRLSTRQIRDGSVVISQEEHRYYAEEFQETTDIFEADKQQRFIQIFREGLLHEERKLYHDVLIEQKIYTYDQEDQLVFLLIATASKLREHRYTYGDDNIILREETLIDGELHTVVEYRDAKQRVEFSYKEGKLRVESIYSDGRLTGRRFFENGQLLHHFDYAP